MLYETGQYEKVLSEIEQCTEHLKDVTLREEWKAKSLFGLGRLEESKALYEELIDRNMSCKEYYEGYLRSMEIDPKAFKGIK